MRKYTILFENLVLSIWKISLIPTHVTDKARMNVNV